MGESLGTLTVWAFKNIKAVFDHYFFTVMRQISFFFISAEKTNKPSPPVAHLKRAPAWLITVQTAQIGSPPNWELCWHRKKKKKVTGLWRQPANKPIIKCFIREAITGNTRHLEPSKETNGGLWRDARTRKEGKEKKSERALTTDLCFRSDRPMCCFICCRPW